MSLELEVLQHLRDQGIEHCVIGATALAQWGFSRFTADIDILTLDARVLAKVFWSRDVFNARLDRIRRGDESDPLAGVVRFKPTPAIDIVVARGALMREAVTTAVIDPTSGWRVATPLALGLMKLEAGGRQDLADVYRLALARRAIAPDDDLVGAIRERLDMLSDWGRRSWERVREDLEHLDAEPPSAWTTFAKAEPEPDEEEDQDG